MTEQYPTVQSFILTGASGAGKSSVAKGLEAITDGPYKFERAKAVVTREQRGPEDDDYIFVSNEEYDALKKAGGFILETPSYNYRGAVVAYTPPDDRTFPLYILTPQNARRLQDVLSPRPRIVHVDRMGMRATQALVSGRPTMSRDDVNARLLVGASDRITAREIEEIGIDNDRELSLTVAALYRMLVDSIDKGTRSISAALPPYGSKSFSCG